MRYSTTQANGNQTIPSLNSQHQKKNNSYALVVEGGGMRGMFSAGVLDSFYELGFDPFHLYLGVSAGSLNLTSHLAGQYLRNYRVVMFSAKSGQFINRWKYLRGGHYIDLDWLCSECMELYPLDTQVALERLEQNSKKYQIVCTSIESGEAKYHHPDEDNILNIILGSCCIPHYYRNPVYVAGERVVDGGISDPIPVKQAYLQGATDIIVIRSRESGYREIDNPLQTKLGYYLYRDYPQLQQLILNLADNYNTSVEFIENPPADLNIFQVAPPTKLNASLTTTDTQLLEMDYLLGRKLGIDFVHAWDN